MTTDIGDGTDSEYKAKLAELLDQLNGVTKRGTRAQVAKTHNKLAHHYVAGRDHEMAIEQFERELDIRKESGEPVAQEACFNNIGSMYYESGRMDLAIAWFTEALTLATTRANSRAVSLAHVNLALAHQRSKQFVQSGHFASLVVDSQESDKPILVSALTILAAAEQHRKELGKAIAHATTALEVAEDVQDAHLLECCLNNLAAYVFESKDYGHAYTIYERCLAVASVPKHQAAALYHMGVCAAEQNHVQVADAHFTRAIDVANSCNAPALVALAQGCLGMLCFFRENLYDAHAELVMALQTARFARSPVAEANIATGLGTVSVMESKFDESATYFESDLAIATTHDDKYGQLRAHCNLGINYLLSGDSSHAMHHFRSNLVLVALCVILISMLLRVEDCDGARQQEGTSVGIFWHGQRGHRNETPWHCNGVDGRAVATVPSAEKVRRGRRRQAPPSYGQQSDGQLVRQARRV
ncbi:hypothetical protein, variant 1 [Aphanomyces astaci]|uniref:Tetratricopeptide repeat protein 29 n=1 Tax=Aphanomyces astaci TaxID=112090 RepID=W4GZU9_APHAT|nr:hypothetical protein, variant 1 [Aphanomyces astaci]ETV85265.1 hypothetical protein, variant 1 [Aphanomyces astaci]|eukprot:XP_009825283.1 hypothetical protein, variant 1 [Aphanomyces astaci]